MQHQFSRTELLIGEEGLQRLQRARVAVFGVGGVGGYVVEALARSGVGTLDLIDNDTVSLTNLNRQIYALHSTIGRYKVEVAKERVLDINPAAAVHLYRTFYLPETAAQFDFSQYDYVVDAIDTVSGKIALILQAQESGTPVISSMGAGNKLDAGAFEVADIYETSICPLAKVMRRELKKRGVERLKVVYSREQPVQQAKPEGRPEERAAAGQYAELPEERATAGQYNELPKVRAAAGQYGELPEARATAGQYAGLPEERTVREESERIPEQRGTARRPVPGSMAFVPAAAGLLIAGEVIKDLVYQTHLPKS